MPSTPRGRWPHKARLNDFEAGAPTEAYACNMITWDFRNEICRTLWDTHLNILRHDVCVPRQVYEPG